MTESALPGIINILSLALWAVLAAVGSLAAWAVKRKITHSAIMSEAMEALGTGIHETYEAYVRNIKAFSADGKLTDEERATAREMAITAARKFASARALAWMERVGQAVLESHVNRLVREAKATAILPDRPEPVVEGFGTTV